jgi:HD-GYP domain-containing protein (c-di-GMP phosphodiesterase class II)
VRDLSTRVGERMGLATTDLTALRHAAELHDVGIVGIPGNLLAKKSRLSEQETEMVRKHPFLGSKMLEGVPGMDATRRAILEHHEHFDGSGYPYGLRGDDISVSARILSIAECYDSAVSARPHRAPPRKKAADGPAEQAPVRSEVAQLSQQRLRPLTTPSLNQDVPRPPDPGQTSQRCLAS